MLTTKEIHLILDHIGEEQVAEFNGYRVVTHGHGYSKNKEIGALQAKLSIMLELASRKEARTNG